VSSDDSYLLGNGINSKSCPIDKTYQDKNLEEFKNLREQIENKYNSFGFEGNWDDCS